MNQTDKSPLTRLSPHVDVVDSSETLAYLELNRRQCFALAYALVGHCRRVGPPTTKLQHEMCGLRDFLLTLLDADQVEVLLGSI